MLTKTKRRIVPVPRGNGYASYVCDVGDPWERTLDNSGSAPEFGAPESYVIAYDDETPRPAMKNCRHVVTKPEYLLSSGYARISAEHDLEFHNFGMVGDFLSLGPTSLEPTPLTLAGFNARAFQAMEPSFEEDIHLTNFVLELVDVKRLLMLGAKWVGMIKSFGYSTSAFRRLTKGQTIHALLKEVANAHLSLSFGIKPFVREVLQMHNVLTGLSDRIADFMARRGVPQVRHYREILYDDSSTQDDGPCMGPDVQATRKIVRTGKVTAHATMYYTYDCPDIVTLGQKVDVLRDLLGLRFGFAQVWEAIPFSFVVDWFIKVQDFLEQLNEPLFKVNLTVTDYCISHKVVSTTEALITTTGARLGPNLTNHVTARVKGSVYVRRVQAPNSGFSFINYGRYGRNQLALSASLAMGFTSVKAQR